MNLRQAQEQARRAVLAFFQHIASLPSGSLLTALDTLGRAQFLEGLAGHSWGTVANRAASGGVHGLLRAISKLLQEIDPTVDPQDSIWMADGSTGMYKSAWLQANKVLVPFGLEAADILSQDMATALGASDAPPVEGDELGNHGSFFYLAGKAFKPQAVEIVSGLISLDTVATRAAAYAKKRAMDAAKHKKVEDAAAAEAVAEGYLPGVVQTPEGEQLESGDFDADTMSMGSWGSIVGAVLANPRDPVAQEVFEWIQDWIENTGRLTELEKRIAGTYILELSTTGTSTSFTQLARDFDVSQPFVTQLLGSEKGRLPTLLAQVLKQDRPDFLNDMDNLRELAQLARGGGGAWKAAAEKKAAEDDKVLRAGLIRLAHENPALRSKILPLLTN